MAWVVKNPPVIQEMQVWALGPSDPLEEEMTTHSSILAWEIPWTEEPGGLQSMGSQRVKHNWVNEHICKGSLPDIILANLDQFEAFVLSL